MKRFNPIFLLSLCAGLFFFVTACEVDPCNDVECLNGGACLEGDCQCPEGFSGENCEIEDVCLTQMIDCVNGACEDGACACDEGYEQDADGICTVEWSAKFLGTNMAVQDTCYGDNGNFSLAYTMTISRTDEKTLSTTNLGGFGLTNVVEMAVTAADSLTLSYTDVAGRVFDGTGYINDDIITINYTTTYSDQTVDTCMAVIMK